MRHRFAIVAGLVICLVGVLAPKVGVAAPVGERLRETREQINRVREQLRAANERRATEAAALDKAKAQVAAALDAVAAAEEAVERQQGRVAAAHERLDDLEAAAERQDRVTTDRLVEIFKRGTGSELNTVLRSGSPAEAVRRSAFVELVTRSDRARLESLAASSEAVDAQRAQLERERAELRQALENEQTLLAKVEDLRDQRAVALSNTEERIEELRDTEEHLHAENDELTALTRQASARERLAAERTGRARSSRASPGGVDAPVGVAPLQGGGWAWPTPGALTSQYGPRWGRMHQGIDIGASTGTPIVAARSGTVDYAGRMSGYGNIVLIRHDGGIVTAYAHQSQILVSTGEPVSAGQRIGSVGCTGRCTGPHLHFEVRVSGAARNPLDYLP